MNFLRVYFATTFKVLTVLSTLIAVLIFVTGKTTLSENAILFSEYIQTIFGGDEKGEKIVQPAYQFVEGSDNLLTTILKTTFVIIAVFFLTFASLVSAILETVIWIVSLGGSRFYCTNEFWNLCWSKIVYNWYWVPSKNLYLWISFLVYSGFFGSQSRNKNEDEGGRSGKRIKKKVP